MGQGSGMTELQIKKHNLETKLKIEIKWQQTQDNVYSKHVWTLFDAVFKMTQQLNVLHPREV